MPQTRFKQLLDRLKCLNSQDSSAEIPAGEIRQSVLRIVAPTQSMAGLRGHIVAEDRVVVAALSPVPNWQVVLPAVAHAISEITGVPVTDFVPDSDGFCFLFPESAIRSMNSGELADLAIPVAFHDADTDSELALLATSCDDQPLNINRRLFDADVIVLLDSPDGNSANSVRSWIYPMFGSKQGRKHFQKQSAGQQRKDLELVESSLGISCAISVMANSQGMITDFQAGDREGVQSRLAAGIEKNWSLPMTSEHDLVIATIASPSIHSGWNEFSAALRIADEFAGHRAPVVLLSEISRPPGAKLAKQFQQSFLDDHATELLHDEHEIAAVLKRHPVFLASRLPQLLVEQLGLGYLDTESELDRLVQQAKNPALIRDAHKCKLASLSPKTVVR